jgi:hypothetical protein
MIGPTPHVEITGVVRGGRFALEAGTIESAGLDAEMTGRISDAGEINGAASGRLSRPLELGGAVFRRATFTADITGAIEAPRIDAMSDADISVAELTGRFATFGEAHRRLRVHRRHKRPHHRYIIPGEGDTRINNSSRRQANSRARHAAFGLCHYAIARRPCWHTGRPASQATSPYETLTRISGTRRPA